MQSKDSQRRESTLETDSSSKSDTQTRQSLKTTQKEMISNENSTHTELIDLPIVLANNAYLFMKDTSTSGCIQTGNG